MPKGWQSHDDGRVERVLWKIHYYKTGICSKPFVPAAFGPGTIGGFCPGSNG